MLFVANRGGSLCGVLLVLCFLVGCCAADLEAYIKKYMWAKTDCTIL